MMIPYETPFTATLLLLFLTPIVAVCGAGDQDQDLLEAMETNQASEVQKCLDNGADVNARDEEIGATALMVACDHKDHDLVELLVNKGADVNKRNQEGATALLFACQQGDSSSTAAVVELLLARGANPQFKTTGGLTPLRHAEKNGHKKVVKLLKAHGSEE